jgi:hypothetical protein
MHCEHVFNVDCLQNYMKAAIIIRKLPLKCPMDKCGGNVYDSDVRQLVPEMH